MHRGPGRNHRGQRRGLRLRGHKVRRPGSREVNRAASKRRLHEARGRMLVQRIRTARQEIQMVQAPAWIGELMTVQV
jgi:hypothetical protein